MKTKILEHPDIIYSPLYENNIPAFLKGDLIFNPGDIVKWIFSKTNVKYVVIRGYKKGFFHKANENFVYHLKMKKLCYMKQK